MTSRHQANGPDRAALPFAGIAGLAFAATWLRTSGTDWPLVAGAAAVAVLLVAIAATLPWARLPTTAVLVLPLACDALIAMLREAQGGSTSGYAPLAILPVAWVGLSQGRRAVVAMTVCTALMFGLPIAIVGGSTYPATGWRGVVLWTIVSFIVGVGANRAIAEQRSQASFAEARSLELDSLVRTQNAISITHSSLDEVMATVAGEAIELTRAEGAVVELPEGYEMVYRAVAGTARPHLGLRLTTAQTLSGHCLFAREVLICADTERDDRVDREACRRVGARSLVVVPLLHDGRATGVLKVYSSSVNAFTETHAGLLALLANMIAAELARAELWERIGRQAVTDELTGLPNRRSWYQQLEVAVARARRLDSPLSILVLDIDGLKIVNDRDGHAAGDRLLKSISSRWSSALRASDILGRTGGDEFAAILENTGEYAAIELVGRLEAALGAERCASVGAATWDRVEDPITLVARADAAMYEHKRGRTTRN